MVYKPSSKSLKPWTEALATVASLTRPRPGPFAGAVGVALEFRIRRPASNRDPYPTAGKGDLDKLERAVLDALTGRVIVDDALVVEIHSKKVWAERPSEEGAGILVYELGPPGENRE